MPGEESSGLQCFAEEFDWNDEARQTKVVVVTTFVALVMNPEFPGTWRV